MKTTITLMAAFAALTAGAFAAPAVASATASAEIVAAEEKTVTLAVTGMK